VALSSRDSVETSHPLFKGSAWRFACRMWHSKEAGTAQRWQTGLGIE